jgi:hypothetical protein
MRVGSLLNAHSQATVSVGWSGYFVAFLNDTMGVEVPLAISQSPFAWNDETGAVALTGGIVNLPAVLISLAVTILLVVGISESAKVSSFAFHILSRLDIFRGPNLHGCESGKCRDCGGQNLHNHCFHIGCNSSYRSETVGAVCTAK